MQNIYQKIKNRKPNVKLKNNQYSVQQKKKTKQKNERTKYCIRLKKKGEKIMQISCEVFKAASKRQFTITNVARKIIIIINISTIVISIAFLYRYTYTYVNLISNYKFIEMTFKIIFFFSV